MFLLVLSFSVFFFVGLSLPSTPEHLQKNRLSEEPLDFNSNSEEQQLKIDKKCLEKDFQDIRKTVMNFNIPYNSPNRVVLDTQVDEIRTESHNDRFDVSIENNVVLSPTAEREAEVNNHEDVNMTSSSGKRDSNCEVTESDQKNLFHNINDGFNSLKLNEKDSCDVEEKVINLSKSDVNSESTKPELFPNVVCNSNTTELFDEVADLENDSFKTDNYFDGFQSSHDKNCNSNHETDATNERVADDFGDFENHLESNNDLVIKNNFDDLEHIKNEGDVGVLKINNCDHPENDVHINSNKNTRFDPPIVEENEWDDDEFGDFSTVVNSNSEEIKFKDPSGNDDEKNSESFLKTPKLGDENFNDFAKFITKSDDFGDFENSPIDTKHVVSSEIVKNSEDVLTNCTTSEGDDGFGDFEQCSSKFTPFETAKKNEDDFGDFEQCFTQKDTSEFASFEEAKSNEEDFGDFETALQKEIQREEDDEFGDFDSCTSARHENIDDNLSIGSKAEQVFSSAFPKVDVVVEEYVHTEITAENQVFDLVKDIMETNALKYQWVNSSSQKVLLKALNIDIRNIVSCFIFFCSTFVF